MKQMKPLRKTFLAVAFVLLCSALATAQVVTPRKPNAPVVQPTTQSNPPPGSDKGIIIVGGKGINPSRHPAQCGLFVIKATATIGQSGDFGRPEQVGSGPASGNAVLEGGYYVCSLHD